MKKSKTGEAPNMALELYKGTVIATALSLLLIVIYAVAMWQQWLTTDSINIFNTVIKALSAAAAGAVATRKCAKRAWLYGFFAGVLYSALAYAVFSILSDVFMFSLAVLADFGIGALSGMLGAMILRAAK